MTEAGWLSSDGPDATEAVGARLGAALRAGDIVVLSGPLGAGKTCLVRGMARGAGGDATRVRSPTFVLHQPVPCATLVLHHIDLYRLGPGADLAVLDLESMLDGGAAVIEWGEHADLAGHAPAVVSIDSEAAGADQRVLRLAAGAPEHLAAAWRAGTRGAGG